MIRITLAVIALGLLGLFGYFFATAPSEQDNAERAKQAAVRVGDTVVDQGVAGLVRARLATKFGLDGTRFLHVYSDEGNVLIYGLLPPEINEAELAGEADKVPGVKDVDVQVVPRPPYLGSSGSGEGAAGEGGG